MRLIVDFIGRCNYWTFIMLLTLAVLVYVFILQKEVQDDFDKKIYFPDNLVQPSWFKPSPEKVFIFTLDLKNFLHVTSKRYLSFSIDTAQIYQGLRNPSLRNPKLRRLVSHLSGGYLRIGGIAADRLVFTPGFRSWPNETLPMDGGVCSFTHERCPKAKPPKRFSMHANDWTELNSFASATGLKMLFDLNALLRDSTTWNSANAQLLLDFSFIYQYDIDWQLGNEPNSFKHLFSIEVPGDMLAKDYTALRSILNSYRFYSSSLTVGPDVTNPYVKDETNELPAKYLLEFLRAKPDIDAISWHHYNTPSEASLDDYLNVETYDEFSESCDIIFETIKKSQISPKPVWLTESGTSYGGGAPNLSDTFVGSLLYADKLGLAARKGISVVVRHSLYRGHYGLINPYSFVPNPDYWVSVLHKKFVKEIVLNLTTIDLPNATTLRAYAQCSTNDSIVIFGVNIANITQGFFLPMTVTGKLYCLHSADLQTRTVELNGKPLFLGPDGSLPYFHWILVDLRNVIPIPSYSVFFLTVAISHPACSL